VPAGTVSFLCNICGRSNTVEALTHEAPTCAGCDSNVRLRALVYMLSMELFGQPLLLPEFPYLPAVKGLGLSDQVSYASILAGKFDYTNTFYDREPRIDITEPHPDRHGTYDFILSSDVFEHIAVPVERAFDECSKLLKPRGVLCMTVPSSLDEHTREHFPDLNEYSIASLGGGLVLINRKKDGTLEVRDGLVFHGGVGATLEMRLFSQKDLERTLRGSGFESVEFLNGAVERFGIVFEGKWSLPLVARKGEFVLDRRAAGQLIGDFCARSNELTKLRQHHEDLVARLEERGEQVDRLDAELAERAAWVARVQEENGEALREIERLQAEFEERTRWAQELERKLAIEAQAAAGFRSQVEALRKKINAIADSRWIKLGNRFGLGPRI
jgi:SAM-dependent methyltransferase